MPVTTVVSVRGLRPEEFLADPNHRYVGRGMPRIGWKGSIFGNPFKPGMDPIEALRIFDAIPEPDRRRDAILVLDGPVDAVEMFAEYAQVRRSLWERIPGLKGKTLGCWCGAWKPGGPPLGCHAVVLACMAEGIEVPRERDLFGEARRG